MIAAVAEKSVNQMSRVVVNIHGAFYVNLEDNKHKHKQNWLFISIENSITCINKVLVVLQILLHNFIFMQFIIDH